MNLRDAGFGILCLLAVGTFAPADEAITSVTGNITVDGKPLSGGRIFIFLDGDEFVGSKVKDGAYKVSRVPAGNCRIGIEGEGVPPSYQSEQTAPFTAALKAGRNTLDFDIKSRKND